MRDPCSSACPCFCVADPLEDSPKSFVWIPLCSRLAGRSRVTSENHFTAALDKARGECSRVCRSLPHRWSLPNPEYYTLRYADGPQLYVTEQASPGQPGQGEPCLQ